MGPAVLIEQTGSGDQPAGRQSHSFRPPILCSQGQEGCNVGSASYREGPEAGTAKESSHSSICKPAHIGTGFDDGEGRGQGVGLEVMVWKEKIDLEQK